MWEDSDGTRHYFINKSSGTYEDENCSGLILTTAGIDATKCHLRIEFLYSNVTFGNGGSTVLFEGLLFPYEYAAWVIAKENV